MAVALILLTASFLPRQLESPPGAPHDSPGGGGSVDAASVIALYSTPYDRDFSTDLTWSWSINNGKSTARFYASVASTKARGSVVFGGPISRLLDNCHLNGVPATPSPGMTDSLGFEPPRNVLVSFEGRREGTVSHIDFLPEPTPGGNVIYCDVRDFASDSPPLHRLYTPMLQAYAQGGETAVQDKSLASTVCVEVPIYSATKPQKECLAGSNGAPYFFDTEELVDLPHEQGLRDAKLLVIGAVAGAAAALVLDSLAGILSAFTSQVIPALRAFKAKTRRWTPKP